MVERGVETTHRTSGAEAAPDRPVGIVVAPDGGLIVSDDEAGLLYRIDVAGDAGGD